MGRAFHAILLLAIYRPAARWAVLCLLVLAGACSNTPEQQTRDEVFARAEFLCLEARWEEAKEVLKAYLLQNPGHAGAHFYLGRTYFFGADFRPAMAEGEFQTALRLFVRDGRTSSIDRFSDEYFEMICNVEAVKVALMEVEILRFSGAERAMQQEHLRHARAYIDEAKAVMPKADDVKTWEAAVEAQERRLSAPAPFGRSA